jgi:hypothetical protein
MHETPLVAHAAPCGTDVKSAGHDAEFGPGLALQGSKLGLNEAQRPFWHCTTSSQETLHHALPYSHCVFSLLQEVPASGRATGQTGLHGGDESSPKPSGPPPPSVGPGPESWVAASEVPESPPGVTPVNTLPPHPRVRPMTAVAAARRASEGTRMGALLG